MIKNNCSQVFSITYLLLFSVFNQYTFQSGTSAILNVVPLFCNTQKKSEIHTGVGLFYQVHVVHVLWYRHPNGLFFLKKIFMRVTIKIRGQTIQLEHLFLASLEKIRKIPLENQGLVHNQTSPNNCRICRNTLWFWRQKDLCVFQHTILHFRH